MGISITNPLAWWRGRVVEGWNTPVGGDWFQPRDTDSHAPHRLHAEEWEEYWRSGVLAPYSSAPPLRHSNTPPSVPTLRGALRPTLRATSSRPCRRARPSGVRCAGAESAEDATRSADRDSAAGRAGASGRRFRRRRAGRRDSGTRRTFPVPSSPASGVPGRTLGSPGGPPVRIARSSALPAAATRRRPDILGRCHSRRNSCLGSVGVGE